ncbi:MAG: hypothetical protein FJY75_04700, partial [Candidatus Eisenbacteria bacterium]|nr:hypothetical protein [Candidatus Eisenbacteria bacterium]
ALGAQADSLRALRAQVRLEQEALAARSAELEGRIESWKALQQADDDAHARQIASLARVYSAMKPEAAARVLVRLDEATFEQIVARLEPRAAGKILALIDPERVARLARPARPSPGGAASSGETGVTS